MLLLIDKFTVALRRESRGEVHRLGCPPSVELIYLETWMAHLHEPPEGPEGRASSIQAKSCSIDDIGIASAYLRKRA